LRKLLQMQSSDHKEIIIRIAQLTDTMTVPSALASILWLLGEYSHRLPKIAPDVLRKMAKTFINQEPVVKLQILNLAAKLAIVNPKQTHLLAQYVFTLARYDQSYDIRDRSRLLRALIFPQSIQENNVGEAGATMEPPESKPFVPGYLAKHARKICLAVKPAPVLQFQSKDRSTFALGSLSHLLNHCVHGYQDLPDWPVVPPNPWSRVVQSSSTPAVSSGSPASSVVDRTGDSRSGQPKSLKDFFSDSEESEGVEDGDDCQEDELDDDEEKEEEMNEGNYASDEDQEETNPQSKTQQQQRAQLWDEHSEDEEVQSDLIEMEPNSASSSSDSEFALGPLQQLIRETKKPTPSVPDASLENDSTEARSASPVTTEPSDSEERTFSSAALIAPKPGSLVRSLLQVAVSAETESDTEDTEGEEDEDLRNLVLPDRTVAKKHVLPIHLKVDSGVAPNQLVQCSNLTAAPPKDLKSSKSRQLVLDDLEKASGTGLSESQAEIAKLVVPKFGMIYDRKLNNCGKLGDTQKTSIISESPSIAIEPALIPHLIDTTPTPLPTLDHCYIQNGSDTEVAPVSPIRSIPFPISYQFTRIVHKSNSNLVVLMLKFKVLSEDSSLSLTDVHLDLRSTVIGRLLLDANRIEPFDPIECLSAQSEYCCTLGIDFAGFFDSIDINLVYHLGSKRSDNMVSLPLSIAPPPGELIRPNTLMNDLEYSKVKGILIQSVLQAANVHYRGAFLCPNPSTSSPVGRHTAPPDGYRSESSSLLFQFNALTISENHPCLFEIQLIGAPWNPSHCQGDNTHSPTSALGAAEIVGASANATGEGQLILTVYCPMDRIRTALCNQLEVALCETIVSSGQTPG
uniref:Adaptin_N domain-containing protein n=1 Tax=Echinostoma caproni TaxID=27848 RepID=A0A183ALE6_9TREM